MFGVDAQAVTVRAVGQGTQNRSGRGLVLGITAAATFGASPFATSLLHEGWSPGALVLFRVLGSAVLLAGPALYLARGYSLTKVAVKQSFLFGFFGVAGVQVCFYNALNHLSVGLTLLIEYSGVLLVVLWMWARHGHAPRPKTIGGGAVALIGLAIALDLLGTSKVDGVGVLWACGGAIGTAGYYIISASSHESGLPALTTIWAGTVSGTLLLLIGIGTGLLPVHTTTTDVVLADHQVNWLVPLICTIVLTGAIAYSTGVLAARYLGARNASFLGLTEVLFGMVFARILVGQELSVSQVLGGLLVLAGVAVVQLDEGLAVSAETIPAVSEAT